MSEDYDNQSIKRERDPLDRNYDLIWKSVTIFVKSILGTE